MNIEKGAGQGCVPSPDLFSLYTQLAMNKLAESVGMKTGGRNIINIRYVDDKVFLADTEVKLQRLMDALSEQNRMKGLKVNKNKTEVIGVTKTRKRLAVNINVEGIEIK